MSMHRWPYLAVSLAVSLLWFTGAAQAEAVLKVKVADETGAVVPRAEVGTVGGKPRGWRTPQFHWKKADSGEATFANDDLCSAALGEKVEGSYQVIARALGFAPTISKIDFP